MAHPAGLEPATIRLEGGCSIQLSYGHLFDSFALQRLSKTAWSIIPVESTFYPTCLTFLTSARSCPTSATNLIERLSGRQLLFKKNSFN
jgi:hypothetical protein